MGQLGNAGGARHPARVVRVLDNTRLVIDRGAADVDVGDRFVIYTLSEEEVRHPQTGESLGQLEVFKGTGKVLHTQETMSIVESDRIPGRRIIRRNPTWLFNSPFREGVEEVTNEEPLPFEDPRAGDYARPI